MSLSLSPSQVTRRVMDADIRYEREQASELSIEVAERVGSLRTLVHYDFRVRVCCQDLEHLGATDPGTLLFQCWIYWPPGSKGLGDRRALTVENFRGTVENRRGTPNGVVSSWEYAWEYAEDNTSTRFYLKSRPPGIKGRSPAELEPEDEGCLTVRLEFDSPVGLFALDAPQHHHPLAGRPPFTHHALSLGVRLSELSSPLAIVSFRYPFAFGLRARLDNAEYCSRATSVDGKFERKRVFFDTSLEERELVMKYTLGTIDATELCTPVLPLLRAGLASLAAGLGLYIYLLLGGELRRHGEGTGVGAAGTGAIVGAVILTPWFVDYFTRRRLLSASADAVRLSVDDLVAFFSFAFDGLAVGTLVGVVFFAPRSARAVAGWLAILAAIVIVAALLYFPLVLLVGAFMGYACDWCEAPLRVRRIRTSKLLQHLSHRIRSVHEVEVMRSAVCGECHDLLRGNHHRAEVLGVSAARGLVGNAFQAVVDAFARGLGGVMKALMTFWIHGPDPDGELEELEELEELVSGSGKGPRSEKRREREWLQDQGLLLEPGESGAPRPSHLGRMIVRARSQEQGRLVVSAIGPDRPGLAQAIFEGISKAHGKVRVAKHAVLLEQSAFLLHVVGEAHLTKAALETNIEKCIAARGWTEKYRVDVSDLADAAVYIPSTHSHHRAHFYCLLKEDKGILASVAAVLSEHRCWIEALASYVVGEPGQMPSVIPCSERPEDDGLTYGVIDMNLWVPQAPREAVDVVMAAISDLGRTRGAYIWDLVPSQQTQRLLPGRGADIWDLVPSQQKQRLLPVMPGTEDNDREVAVLTLHHQAELKLVLKTGTTLAQRGLTIIASMIVMLEGRISMICMLAKTADSGTADLTALVNEAMTDIGVERHHYTVTLKPADAPTPKQPGSLFTATAYSTGGPGDLLALTSALAKYNANIVQLVADVPREHSRRIEIDFDVPGDPMEVYEELKALRAKREAGFTSFRWNTRPKLWLDYKQGWPFAADSVSVP